MTDGIIKGTGNSRFLKGPPNAAALYPDFESFRDAWAAGTLPVDFNGINPAGWEVLGDKLDKSTLLTDALCTALGISTASTPTQAMEKLRQMVVPVESKAKICVGSYEVTETGPKTLVLPFAPKLFIVGGRDTFYYQALQNIRLKYGFFIVPMGYGMIFECNARVDNNDPDTTSMESDITLSGTTITFKNFDVIYQGNQQYPRHYIAIG